MLATKKRNEGKGDRERFPEKIWKILEDKEKGIRNKKSRECVIKYLDYLQGDRDAKFSTLKNAAHVLKKLANAVDKPLADLEKGDINLYLSNNKKMAETTKALHKVIIKTFYNHLGKDLGLKIKRVKVDREPGDMLTKQEILKMVENAGHLRNKAMVMFLWESGFRVGEFLSLRIVDIDLEETMAHITLSKSPGLKTGRRTILVVESVPYLRQWIEAHPYKSDRNSPLWVRTEGENGKDSITDQAFRKLLKRIAKRSGIAKDITAHLFRHSRATERSGKWSDAKMRKYFGWSPGSPMPSDYSHMSSKELDKDIKCEHGLDLEEEEVEPLAVKKCYNPDCQAINGCEMLYCGNCGTPLDAESYKELKEKQQKYEVYRLRLLKELVDKVDDKDVIRLLSKKDTGKA